MRERAGRTVARSTARAAGSSRSVRTSDPVMTSPPCARRSSTIASTMDWLPPIGTGQPRAWA